MQLSEIETMLGISSQHLTFAQYEKSYTDALGALATQQMMSEFRSEKVSIIDLDKVTKHFRMPKINKNSCFMTPVGKNAKQRANMEAERRFCGDEDEMY